MMNRKKHLTLSIALVFSLSLNAPVFSAGVPTVSVAELTQLVVNAQQQALQALAQLEKAKESILQAKNQYEHYKDIMEGNDKLGAFLDDPYVNKLLSTSDWKDIYNKAQDLPDLRKRYGLSGYEPDVQKIFDKLLSQVGVLEDQYKATNIRKENAEALRKKLDTVETPAEREQLAIRYQQEQLEMMNQQAQLQNTRYLQEQQEKIEDKKRAQDFKNYMLGKRDDLPVYN